MVINPGIECSRVVTLNLQVSLRQAQPCWQHYMENKGKLHSHGSLYQLLSKIPQAFSKLISLIMKYPCENDTHSILLLLPDNYQCRCFMLGMRKMEKQRQSQRQKEEGREEQIVQNCPSHPGDIASCDEKDFNFSAGCQLGLEYAMANMNAY